jgi:hypothetical protein
VKPELLDLSRSHEYELLRRCLSRTTPTSPFGPGRDSVDLGRLTQALLGGGASPRNRIAEDRIEVDGRCTCCATDGGDPPHWSLTRAKAQGGPDGRNCSLAWLERPGSRPGA